MFDRVCQIVDLGSIAVANVHLSHGQFLNRRQLRRIAKALPHRAAVVGDYNLVGPALLPGFRDVGPREPTHIAGDMVPLRIDRCLVRGRRMPGSPGAAAGGFGPSADRCTAACRGPRALGRGLNARSAGSFRPVGQQGRKAVDQLAAADRLAQQGEGATDRPA